MDFSRAHVEKPNNIWKFWMFIPPMATSNSAPQQEAGLQLTIIFMTS